MNGKLQSDLICLLGEMGGYLGSLSKDDYRVLGPRTSKALKEYSEKCHEIGLRVCNHPVEEY
jgi:hypothetical protein